MVFMATCSTDLWSRLTRHKKTTKQQLEQEQQTVNDHRRAMFSDEPCVLEMSTIDVLWSIVPHEAFVRMCLNTFS